MPTAQNPNPGAVSRNCSWSMAWAACPPLRTGRLRARTAGGDGGCLQETHKDGARDAHEVSQRAGRGWGRAGRASPARDRSQPSLARGDDLCVLDRVDELPNRMARWLDRSCEQPLRSVEESQHGRRAGERASRTLGKLSENAVHPSVASRALVPAMYARCMLKSSRVFSSKWIDRQIDDALLMVSTATAAVYARRQARRHLPKVIVGGALVAAAGTAAAVAATGIGILAAGGAGAAWYRHNKKTSSSDWQMPRAATANGANVDQQTAAPASASK